ncbi:MAG: aminotransferase class I/II-fold pyridoxal phosphate-dependent enzyme [Gemmatimonas sp.]
MTDLDAYARAKLAAIDRAERRRTLAPTARSQGLWLDRDGKRLLSFSCNDYLGLSLHPDVIAASVSATARYGAGAGASRYITGNSPLYRELEAALARLKGADESLVFATGYLANIGVIPALVGPGDLIVADELMHASMHAGAKLSGAEIILFRHNDARDCARLLEARRAMVRHALILTEGVFSMDGDRAPVAELFDVAQSHDAWLMTDDAHALGVIGGGRGSGVDRDGRSVGVPLQMGTLSKAVGALGGYVAASSTVIDMLRHRARSAIYSTALPPGVVAAAVTALGIIERDPALCGRPLALARRFTAQIGLPEAESAIVPVIVGPEDAAMTAQAALADAGFMVVAIRPPTVPVGTCRLRIAFSAAHREEDVDRLAATFENLGIADAARRTATATEAVR